MGLVPILSGIKQPGLFSFKTSKNWGVINYIVYDMVGGGERVISIECIGGIHLGGVWGTWVPHCEHI